MVKSGLVDRPDVSHYRLTVHLGMAFLLYVALLWTGLEQLRKESALLIRILLCDGTTDHGVLNGLSGGLVAGLDAGQQFNTFPLMAGQLVPEGLFVQALVSKPHRECHDGPVLIGFWRSQRRRSFCVSVLSWRTH